MASNILMSPTLPIHTGLNGKGTLRKLEISKKTGKLAIINKPVSLIIGNH